MSVRGFVNDVSASASLSGVLDSSALRQTVWSRDASHFQITPQVTARARHIDDVSGLLRAAHRFQVSVTFRAGGSSLSGQALGDGLVVDVRSGFQHILDISDDSVRAQVGVTVSRLNGHLLRRGRKIGPDPASMIVSTLGGVVANNSSGMSCGIARNSYATLRGATIVFADGFILDTTQPDAKRLLADHNPTLVAGLEQLRDHLRSNPELTAEIRRQFSLKNTMGYSVQAFLDYETVTDIVLHLMVGSQGTLGFVADVTFDTLPLNPYKASTLLVFDTLSTASDTLLAMAACDPAAIELLDHTSLSALNHENLLPSALTDRVDGHSVAVLVDFESDNPEDLALQTQRFGDQFSANIVLHHQEGHDRDVLWKARKNLYAVVAKNRKPGTTALLEDIVVPPEALTTACQALTSLCEEFGYASPVFFGHVKDGNLHFMISDNFSDPARISALGDFTERMADIVLGLGGNLKAEHGAGRAMAPFVKRQFGPELFSAMHHIKTLFDPLGILNPGVIFTDDPFSHLQNVKNFPAAHDTVDSCVECGFCESSCPSAGLTLTPRERIVAMREGIGSRSVSGVRLTRAQRYEIDQTCAVDGMCAVNCPVGINTGQMVKQLRDQQTSRLIHVSTIALEKLWTRGMTAAGWALRAAATVPRLASGLATAARAVTPAATIPDYDPGMPADGFKRSGLRQEGGEFVFLASCMNTVFGDTSLEEFLQIATEHGVAIAVPEEIDSFCCGTPFSSKGFVSAAKNRAAKNTALLESLTNHAIVIDGSSCHDTLHTLSDKPPLEITEFIATYLLDVPVTKRHPLLVLHPTCSGEKTGTNRAMKTIARHIADDVYIPIDWKCCGFGGDRGLLVPELTGHATRAETAETSYLDGLRVSNNQPCQVGLSRSAPSPYVSIVSAWVEAVR